jgi:hypothetical protein
MSHGTFHMSWLARDKPPTMKIILSNQDGGTPPTWAFHLSNAAA